MQSTTWMNPEIITLSEKDQSQRSVLMQIHLEDKKPATNQEVCC